MRDRWITGAAPLFLLALALFASPNGLSTGAAAPQNETTTALTGLWSLNKDLSDDPSKVIRALQTERHGGSGGGGHGPGMHGGGTGGGRGGTAPDQMRAEIERAVEPPGRLTITQTDSSITLVDGDGRSQTLTTSNKKETLPLDNRTVEVKTKWDGGRLVKETSLGNGMKLTETYSLSFEPRQLHVMVKLDSSHLPRPANLRRVYDDADSRR